MAEQNFNQRVLVDFNKLSVGDYVEIQRLENEFKSNGWCFIRLPNNNDKLLGKLDHVVDVLSAFFARPTEEKSLYESSNAFGYLHTCQKENIRVLMDERGLTNHHRFLTNDVEEALKDLSIFLTSLVNVLKPIILQMATIIHSPDTQKVSLSSLYMLDVVRYFNDKIGPVQQPKIGFNTDEVNCVPHFDPGLFSLSILSTCDGLQLKDVELDEWIDGPNSSDNKETTIGIIWLGEAASLMTRAQFQSGIHRVVYPRIVHQERFTIWVEACTKNQIDQLLKTNNEFFLVCDHSYMDVVHQKVNVERLNQNSEETSYGAKNSDENENIFQENTEDEDGVRDLALNYDNQHRRLQTDLKSLPSEALIIMTNQPGSKPLHTNLQSETLNDFMKRVENERGLPASKTGVEHLKIRFPMRVKKTADQSNSNWSFFSNLFKW